MPLKYSVVFKVCVAAQMLCVVFGFQHTPMKNPFYLQTTVFDTYPVWLIKDDF